MTFKSKIPGMEQALPMKLLGFPAGVCQRGGIRLMKRRLEGVGNYEKNKKTSLDS